MRDAPFTVRLPNKASKTYRMRFKSPHTGLVVDRSTGVRDRGLAWQIARQAYDEDSAKAAGLHNPYKATLTCPIADLITEFIEFQEGEATTAKHVREHELMLEKLVDSCGWRTLADMTPESFERWRAQERRKPERAAATRNRYLAPCKKLWTWLRRQNRVGENVFDRVRKEARQEKAARKRRRWLTVEEQQQLLGHMRSDKAEPVRYGADAKTRHLIYRTALETGLRRGELEKLTKASVTPDAILLPSATSKNRNVDSVRLRQGLAMLLVSRCLRLEPGDLLFPRHFLAKSAKALREDAADAKLAEVDDHGDKLVFHGLRKTFICTLVNQGLPPKVVQVAARHKTLSQTMDIYAELGKDKDCVAIDALPDFDGLSPDLAKTGTTA